MIEQQTLLILGAGASHPYGYPTGAGLRTYICKEFPRVFSRLTGETVPPSAKKKAENFADGFQKSSTASIDLFLARNPSLSEFGKKAIVVNIMESETRTAFREDVPKDYHDWYSYLFKRMTDELIIPDSYSHFSDNKIAFLTFNYDRSLEWFLEESLLYAFQFADPQKIKDQLSKITIHHIHGCVDRPQWLGGRPYGHKYALLDVNALCQNIKIVHEIAGMKKEVQTIIEKAYRIFFLGFGYAKENLQALGIGTVNYGYKQIFGTALGLSDKELVKSGEYLQSHFPDPAPSPIKEGRGVLLQGVDSLELLKRYL